MYMILRSIPFSRKERLHNRLLAAGGGSVEDIFAIEYGEWPPKGLDVDGTAKDISFGYKYTPESESKEYNIFSPEFYSVISQRLENYRLAQIENTASSSIRRRITDRAHLLNDIGRHVYWGLNNFSRNMYVAGLGGNGNIYLNPLTSILGSVKTTGHEAVHICQSDLRSVVVDPKGLMSSRRYGVGAAMDQVITRAEKPKRTLKRHARNEQYGSGRSHRFLPPNYYSQEIEIQARMHSLMTKGYKRWGKVPANKLELWAALRAQGVEMPLRIKKELKSSPEGRKAMKDFRPRPWFARTAKWLTMFILNRNATDTDARRINRGFGSFPREQREAVWHEVFPTLYATLIEFYGDIQGRERFGLGKSLSTERLLYGAINNKPQHFDYDDVVRRVSPDLAGLMAFSCFFKKNPSALDALLTAHPNACKDWHSGGDSPRNLVFLVATSGNSDLYSVMARHGLMGPHTQVVSPGGDSPSVSILRYSVVKGYAITKGAADPNAVNRSQLEASSRGFMELSTLLVRQGANAAERVTVPGANGKPDERMSLYELSRRAGVELPPAPFDAAKPAVPEPIPVEDQNISLMVRPPMGLSKYEAAMTAGFEMKKNSTGPTPVPSSRSIR
jgi:hypothetical protein